MKLKLKIVRQKHEQEAAGIKIRRRMTGAQREKKEIILRKLK